MSTPPDPIGRPDAGDPDAGHPDGSPVLDPSPKRVAAMGEATVRLVRDYLERMPAGPVQAPGLTSAGIRDALTPELPIEGEDFGALLGVIDRVLYEGSRHNGHPRFFGYVASPGTASGACADFLASALNTNVTSFRSAPAATELERLTIGWIREILGCPPGTDGLFVSGGSIANLCGIGAARDAKAPVPVTKEGAQALGRPMVLYLSAEGHDSIPKAMGILGLGRANARAVATDASLRLDPACLEAAIRADLGRGDLPFCVVASVGTVNTGACDDLEAIAGIAERYGLWFHVDASYGGFAALSPTRRALFRGIERADSIALDPHKWLYLPSDCGCILYRDPARARAVFGHDAEYTRVLGLEADEAYAFWDYGPELSRRFRALKVWLVLSHAGTRVLGEAIEENCRCAEHLARLVEASEDLELLAPVTLSIFCFRHVPAALRSETGPRDPETERALDRWNEEILLRLQAEAHSYLSNARVHGRFALRGCVLNYRTRAADMEILLDDVRRAARDLGDRI